MTFCGPVLIGESITPLGARLRFPALSFKDAAGAVRVVGSVPLAWHAKDRFETLIVTNAKDVDAREVTWALFEPMLFYLAMLAGTAAELGQAFQPDRQAGKSDLLAGEVVLHVAHQAGIARWPLPPGTITPTEASTYLAELTRDFLDPTQFDLLPFELLRDGFELKRAYDSTFAGQIGADVFRDLLQDKISDARENTFPRPKIPPLVEMIGAQAPDDALAKVQQIGR